jgi:hypothetical protein
MSNRREWTYDEFEKTYGTECKQKFRVDAEWVYYQYYDKVELNLGIITKYLTKEKPITHEELKAVLGLSHSTWLACKHYFPEFKRVLDGKVNIMKFKSEGYLMRGIENAVSNPKLIELALQMYNDDYKPKGVDLQVNLPKTLNITIADASSSEDELEKIEVKVNDKETK